MEQSQSILLLLASCDQVKESNTTGYKADIKQFNKVEHQSFEPEIIKSIFQNILDKGEILILIREPYLLAVLDK